MTKFSGWAEKTVLSAGPSSEWVRLWNYDSGKCDLEIDSCEASEHLIGIGFVDEKPSVNMIITSDSRGNVVFWGSIGCKWSGMRIAGLLNISPHSATLEPRQRQTETDEAMSEELRETLRLVVPKRALVAAPRDDSADVIEAVQSGNESCDKHEDSCLSYFATLGCYHPHCLLRPNRPGRDKDPIESKDVQSSLANARHAVNSSIYQKAVSHLVDLETKDSELVWGRAAAATCFAFDAKNGCLYTGDDTGQVRKFSVRNLLTALDDVHGMMSDDDNMGEPIPMSEAFFRVSSDLKNRDGSSALLPHTIRPTVYLLTPSTRKQKPKLPYLGIDFCWTLNAHLERVLSCNCTTYGLFTSSSDQLVKLWSTDGRPLGTLIGPFSIPTDILNLIPDFIPISIPIPYLFHT